jgi:hypothetical protein
LPGRSEAHEKLEISVPAHSRSPKQVLDDEYGNLRVSRNDQRASDACLDLDHMIASLPVEDEPIPFK